MVSGKIQARYPAWVGRAVALGALLHLGSAFGAGCPAPSFDIARPFDPGPSPGVAAVADFNGDGNLDIATLWSIALGNGDGTFQAPISNGAGVVGNVSCLAVGDFNQDGKADLVITTTVAGTPSGVWVLLGQGDGRFQVGSSNQIGYKPISIVVGDVNGDGKSDLILANGFGSDTISVLLGQGDGTFQDPMNFDYSAPGYPTFVALGDFNRDGNLDLAITDTGPVQNGYSGSSVSVLLGNGDGTFQPAVGYDVGRNPGWVIVSDFNGDGKSDLAVVNFFSEDISLLLGNGDGTFRSAVNYSTPITPQSLAVGDFNGDGKPDLAVGGRVVSVLLGNGNGTFQSSMEYDASGLVVGGDFNGDGKIDLATLGSVLLGRGDGTFYAARSYAVGPNPTSVAVGDFDGDGQPDLAVADSGGSASGIGSISVLMGNGDGVFRPAVNYEAGVEPWFVATGDFNGDGKPDLAVANAGSRNVSVLLGRGDGTFLPAVNSSAGEGPWFLAVADFNGDNKLDLAVACAGTLQNGFNDGSVSLLLGNGDGTLQAAGSITIRYPRSIALGDFDGDGKTDLAVVLPNTGLLVVHGNGDGTLGGSATYAAGTGPAMIVAGDLNGDHKPDLVVYNAGNGVNQFQRSTSIFVGNGDGTFQPAVNSILPQGSASAGSMALADLNGDGRLDLVVCGGSALSVMLGNGDGTLQTSLRLATGGDVQGAAVGDFNGDGKPDIVVAHRDYNFVTPLLNTCDADGVQLASVRIDNAGMISWPLGSGAYVLESTTNLASTNWQAVVEKTVTNSGRVEVAVTPEQTQRYFRLHAQ